MASLCGLTFLAIFPCLFFYDEAVRRDADVEALSSYKSSEVRQVSSDQLELRDARTDAKLVRSHDTSFFFKKGKKEKKAKPTTTTTTTTSTTWTTTTTTTTLPCSVKVADTTCVLEGQFSSTCCEQFQAEACLQFKDYNATWTGCDKFDEASFQTNSCSREEVLAKGKDMCLFNAGKNEMNKAMQQLHFKSSPACSLKKAPYDCELQWLSPACCERHQAFSCEEYETATWKLCDKFKGMEFQDLPKCDETDKLALRKNHFLGNCVQNVISARSTVQDLD